MPSIVDTPKPARMCPKCGEISVFDEKVYRKSWWRGFVYIYTIEKCYMGNPACQYDSRILTRKILIEKTYNHERILREFVKKAKAIRRNIDIYKQQYGQS